MIACAIAGVLLMPYSLEVLPKAENPSISLFTWLLAKLIIVKSAPNLSFVYKTANVLAAALIRMAHLPLASAIFGGLTPAVVADTIVPNQLL